MGQRSLETWMCPKWRGRDFCTHKQARPTTHRLKCGRTCPMTVNQTSGPWAAFCTKLQPWNPHSNLTIWLASTKRLLKAHTIKYLRPTVETSKMSFLFCWLFSISNDPHATKFLAFRQSRGLATDCLATNLSPKIIKWRCYRQSSFRQVWFNWQNDCRSRNTLWRKFKHKQSSAKYLERNVCQP